MRYAKVMTADGAGYVSVEEREGTAWAVAAVAGPEEDALGLLKDFTAQPLERLQLLAPVRPGKIVCVGRNYRDHAAELGNEVPKEPLIFLKAPSSVLEPGGVVRMPAVSKRIDFEGELAVVVGRRCTGLGPAEDVRPYLRGYTLVNDVTARDLQKTDGQWTRAKGFDTFCPVGPWVSDEIDPLHGEAVTVITRLNGEVRQTGTTADFIFSIAEVMRYITSFMMLEPGDLIPTGTPAGVGAMQAGDVVEVEIAGLGVLRNSLEQA